MQILIILILIIILIICKPLNLRWKTQLSATSLLPTWIFPCRTGGMFSCGLPFATNMTMSTSLSYTFRSWVAIFPLRQPWRFNITTRMVCQGFLLLLMLYSERAQLSCKLLSDMSGIVWNRISGNSKVVMGLSWNIIKFRSFKCYLIFHLTVTLLLTCTLSPALTLFPNSGRFP